MVGGFLSRLDDATRARLVEASVAHSFTPGTQIFGSDNRDWVGVVKRGAVRIYADSADGRRITHRYVRVGGVVGLAALIGASSALAAQAVGVTEVLQLDIRLVRQLRGRDAPFCLAVAEETLDRLLDADALLRMRGKLAARLALELVDMVAESPQGQWTKVEVTHDALADAVGTSREVVSRHLEQLSARGLLQQVRRAWSIRHVTDGDAG
jgi:CRP-like cAMP-binding protein